MSITELKALQDEIDALIAMKERCETEDEDDYVDDRIHQLLMRIMDNENL